jgi:hypothetical protein
MGEARSATRGFGYQAERAGGYYFEVRSSAAGIAVLERFAATGDSETSAKRTEQRERATLNALRWNLVQSTVASDFNHRLQQAGLRPGRWLKQATPLAPHFGKELVLLIWAIDDQEPTVIPRMLANWRGLAPEERWWFYTTINASTRARANDRSYGWMAAIKIAFLDEPRDIGMESLRLSDPTHVTDQLKRDGRRARSANDQPTEQGETPRQGRLFAEPDAPGYNY